MKSLSIKHLEFSPPTYPHLPPRYMFLSLGRNHLFWVPLLVAYGSGLPYLQKWFKEFPQSMFF